MNLPFSENIEDWDRVENSQSGHSDTWKYVGLESQFVSHKMNYSSTMFPALKDVSRQVLKVVNKKVARRRTLKSKNISKLVVQRFVRGVIAVAVKELGKPDHSYSVKGSEFLPTLQRITDKSLVKQTRVYCPLSGKPDIEIVSKMNDAVTDSTVKVEPESFISFIGPPAVTKSKIEKEPGPQIIQTAAYAMHFLLRVFPMLEEELLKDVFEDRCVYTLVLPHKELIVVKQDVSEFIIQRKVPVLYSDTMTGGNYVAALCSWVQWACTVSEKLVKYKDKLNSTNLVNSWVPSSAYMKHFGIGSLEPCPSFYNPMYRSKTHYFRINRSFWCGNGNSKAIETRRLYADQFKNYIIRSEFWMGVPNYGVTLCQKKGTLTLPSLKITLASILNFLVSLGNICHMDIRCANVIVKGNFEEVHLIDFDFATDFQERNRMSRGRIEYAPETYAHPNSDL